MWRWDQGHMAYTQFPSVRRIAEFVCSAQFVGATRTELLKATGLDFKHPDQPDYNPWRQYARALKVMLLVSEHQGLAVPTPVAKIIKKTGVVTSDEYFHFLAEVTTEPNPAFKNYDFSAEPRYPLLFALKYLLAKVASGGVAKASRNEIIGAYARTPVLSGAERDQAGHFAFIQLTEDVDANVAAGKLVTGDPKRQARESLATLTQISYLHQRNEIITISLSAEDAGIVFRELNGVQGPFLPSAHEEIQRRAQLFAGGSTHDFFDFPTTILADVVESGFTEGGKLKKTHIVIERNRKLRDEFFAANPSPVCGMCSLETRKTYDWTERVLDMHHLLPLAAGTRTDGKTTALGDLVAVCPTCHRAIHRYYDVWLKASKQQDFETVEQAKAVYEALRTSFPGAVHV